MVQLIKSSFGQLLDANTWMDPVTKKIAKEKLLAIQSNVAAPGIVFDDEKLEKDVFSGHWPTGFDVATIINALYLRFSNGIYLTGGIAQIPVYGLNRPISVNLGSLGTLVGHELTHGFDNQGSKYDLNGQYKNWWANDTLEKFHSKYQCFIKQYNEFNVTEVNQFVNGSRTLGEKIADNGGMREAFYALQNYKKQSKQPIDKLPGELAYISDEKLFFLSFANLYCENRDKTTFNKVYKNDIHSPAHARAVLSLANFDQFAKT